MDKKINTKLSARRDTEIERQRRMRLLSDNIFP